MHSCYYSATAHCKGCANETSPGYHGCNLLKIVRIRVGSHSKIGRIARLYDGKSFRRPGRYYPALSPIRAQPQAWEASILGQLRAQEKPGRIPARSLIANEGVLRLFQFFRRLLRIRLLWLHSILLVHRRFLSNHWSLGWSLDRAFSGSFD
jgi:hypothetical protein